MMFRLRHRLAFRMRARPCSARRCRGLSHQLNFGGFCGIVK